MKLFSKIFFLLVLASFHLESYSQNDSTRVLNFENLQSMVVKHHPISKKIGIKTDMANMYLMKAKGNFDPKVIGNIYQKYLNDQTDFSLVETQIKSNTRSPISLVGGYDLNKGLALNPQGETGLNGITYAGVSFSVLQGLLTDPSRTELKKAELFQVLTVYEQQILMNDLLYYSGKMYWEWFVAYHIQELYQEAADLAAQRLDFVKQSSLLGDRPYLDTLEASIFYNSIDLLYQQSKMDYQNSSLNLSLFLWDENGTPLVLKETVIPPNLDQISTSDSILSIVNNLKNSLVNHPEILRYDNYLDNLLLDKKLFKEQLKPVLDLKYNFITKSLSYDPIVSTNNYTWGLNFQMPIFLRKERANLRLIDLKMQENEFDRQYKVQSVNVEFQKALNKWELSTDQLSQWKNMVDNYLKLARGEQELFESGESSIFLMNTRQVNYLNSKMKFLEMISKNNESLLATFKAAGALTLQP
jgi:outer membrane protein TolC